MRKQLSIFVAALLFAVPAQAETLIFAPLPMESRETTASQWKPLLDYLEASLGVTVRIEYSPTNQAVVDKFMADRIDLAYLGPLPYVRLREETPLAQPVVLFREKNGEATYTCAIVTSAEEPFRRAELTGQKIALTQPLSTCGYFATEGMLRQAGSSLERNRYRYLVQHDQVALAVVRGEFDLGGLKTTIARKYAHLGLQVVAETAPLPGLALVANGTRLTSERIEQIRQALLHADAETMKGWGDNIRHGVARADDRDYDGVRELCTDSVIPEQGNF